MAVIVAVTGFIGIRSIGMVGSRVSDLMQTRADQQKLALQLQAAERTSRVALLEAMMGHVDAKTMATNVESYHKNRDIFRRYSNALRKGDPALGIRLGAVDTVMEEHAKTLMETWSEYEKVADKIIAYKAGVLSGSESPSALVESRLISELSGASEFVARDIDDLIETVKGLMQAVGQETRQSGLRSASPSSSSSSGLPCWPSSSASWPPATSSGG